MSKKPFFVLTTTRSGSTWFLSLLNGQNGVSAFEELFIGRDIRPHLAWVAAGSPERYHRRRPDLQGPEPRRLWQYLDEIATHATDARAFGFKLMIGQVRATPWLLPVLAARRYRLVLLVRENLFASTLSGLVMNATGDPHGVTKAERSATIEIDVDELIARMKNRQRGLALMRAIRTTWPWPSVEVGYEALREDQSTAIGSVMNMLGLSGPPTFTESALKRRSERPYLEMIINYNDVKIALKANNFEKFIESN